MTTDITEAQLELIEVCTNGIRLAVSVKDSENPELVRSQLRQLKTDVVTVIDKVINQTVQ